MLRPELERLIVALTLALSGAGAGSGHPEGVRVARPEEDGLNLGNLPRDPPRGLEEEGPARLCLPSRRWLGPFLAISSSSSSALRRPLWFLVPRPAPGGGGLLPHISCLRQLRLAVGVGGIIEAGGVEVLLVASYVVTSHGGDGGGGGGGGGKKKNVRLFLSSLQCPVSSVQ